MEKEIYLQTLATLQHLMQTVQKKTHKVAEEANALVEEIEAEEATAAAAHVRRLAAMRFAEAHRNKVRRSVV